ncbi:hypothetical protein, partial [Vibrio cholerae]|uniref:hypothetical protein n=1 Tax=Vibrio cholerae TaxID=666 RepID=UPI0009B26D89
KHESIITPTVPADGSGGNALNPGLVGGYLPDIGVPDPIISLSMTLDGNLKFDSSLLCNDQDASHFQISQKDNVFCTINGRSIATFTAPFDANKNGRNTDSEVFSLGRLLDSQGRVINGVSYFSNNTRGITGV